MPVFLGRFFQLSNRLLNLLLVLALPREISYSGGDLLLSRLVGFSVHHRTQKRNESFPIVIYLRKPLKSVIDLVLDVLLDLGIRLISPLEVSARIMANELPNVHRDGHHYAIVARLEPNPFELKIDIVLVKVLGIGVEISPVGDGGF